MNGKYDVLFEKLLSNVLHNPWFSMTSLQRNDSIERVLLRGTWQIIEAPAKLLCTQQCGGVQELSSSLFVAHCCLCLWFYGAVCMIVWRHFAFAQGHISFVFSSRVWWNLWQMSIVQLKSEIFLMSVTIFGHNVSKLGVWLTMSHKWDFWCLPRCEIGTGLAKHCDTSRVTETLCMLFL